MTVSTLFGRVGDGSTGASVTVPAGLPVPAVALVLVVLPVPAVFSETVAVLPVPAVLSEVFVLLVLLLFPTSSALLTIGVASSVPLMTSVTSFRDIFFFFMRSPLYLLLHAFFMR